MYATISGAEQASGAGGEAHPGRGRRRERGQRVARRRDVRYSGKLMLHPRGFFCSVRCTKFISFILQNPSQTGIFVHLFSETVIIVQLLEISVQFFWSQKK